MTMSKKRNENNTQFEGKTLTSLPYVKCRLIKEMKKIISLCFLSVAICACTGGGGNTAGEQCDAVREYAEWDSVTCKECSRPMGDEENKPSCSVDVSVETAVGRTPVDSSISRAVAAVVFGDTLCLCPDAVRHYADSVKRSFAEEMSEFYDPDDEYAFRFHYTYEVRGGRVSDSKEGMVAYRASETAYQGGAHGSFAEVCLNMDASTGRELFLSDVFKEDKMDRVKELMEQQLMADHGMKSMEQLRDSTGITMLAEVFVSDYNFLLLKDGVLFVFNPYDIAPWAVGTVEVKLTYDQLEGCLK